MMDDLIFTYTETRFRHGYTEAVCPECKEWVRISSFYKGKIGVVKSIPHKYPCQNFANALADKTIPG